MYAGIREEAGDLSHCVGVPAKTRLPWDTFRLFPLLLLSAAVHSGVFLVKHCCGGPNLPPCL